jgi:hypothetical protein
MFCVYSIEREMCHIQHPGGDTEQFFLSPPDVANGVFLEILEFWDGGKMFG